MAVVKIFDNGTDIVFEYQGGHIKAFSKNLEVLTSPVGDYLMVHVRGDDGSHIRILKNTLYTDVLLQNGSPAGSDSADVANYIAGLFTTGGPTSGITQATADSRYLQKGTDLTIDGGGMVTHIDGNPVGGGEVTLAQLSTKVDQTVYDAMVATNATDAELAAVNAKIDAEIAEGKKVTSIVRETAGVNIGGLLITFDDASTSQIPPNGVVSETDPVYTAEKPNIALKSELHPQETKASVEALGVDYASLTNPPDLSSLHDGAVQDAALNAHIADNEKHLPGVFSAGQLVRRNAANDGWETVDLPISISNLVSGPGVPGAGLGEDGYYYQQIDAALGTNDIWGPKAGGAWPAQADFKSADPESTTPAQAVSTTGADYTTPRSWATENLDQWGQSRRVQRIFDVSVDFDYPALNYVDRTAVYVRNANAASGISYTYRTDNSISLELRRADGTTQSAVADQHNFNVQPGEIVFGEKDGNVFRASIIPAERVKAFTNYVTANAFGPMPHDSIVIIRDTGEVWARKTGINNRSFPLDGQENVDWFKVAGGGDEVIYHAAETDEWQWGKLNIYPNGANLDNAVSPAVQANREALLGTLDLAGTGYVLYRHYVGNSTGNAILNRSGDQVTSTYTGLQKISEWVNPSPGTQIGTSLTAYATGLDMTNVDRVLVNFIDTANLKAYPHQFNPKIRDQSWFWGYSGETSHAEIIITDLATGAMQFRRGGSRALYLHSVELWAEAANGFVIPTASQLVTDRQLVVTSPTATPNITIIEEQASRYLVNVTAGKQLVLGPVVDANIQLLSPIDGVIIAQATGPNPTVTFTEVNVPTNVSQRGVALPNATWTDVVAGLQIHQGTGADDRPYIRFNDGIRRVFEVETWYAPFIGGDWLSRVRGVYIANTSVPTAAIDLRGDGYNLAGNYEQYIVITNVSNGESWRIKYTMDATDNDAVMDFDYWSENRTNPFN